LIREIKTKKILATAIVVSIFSVEAMIVKANGVYYELEENGGAYANSEKSASDSNGRMILRSVIVVNGRKYSSGSIRGKCPVRSSVVKVAVPADFEFLGDGCFYKCQNLSEMAFEDGSKLRRIGMSALAYTKLQSILVPAALEVIIAGCFQQCRDLLDITFEKDSRLREIGKSAFNESGLKSIRIPSDLKIVDAGCFDSCENLSEIIFENGFRPREIGTFACGRCRSLKSIRIPSGIEILREGCFYGCKNLREIIFEENSKLRRIEKNVFRRCEVLEQIRIPADTEFLGEESFSECKCLREVIFEADSKIRKIEIFAFIHSNVKSIRIPESANIGNLRRSFLIEDELVEILRFKPTAPTEDKREQEGTETSANRPFE
jgi:hypothetical protein